MICILVVNWWERWADMVLESTWKLEYSNFDDLLLKTMGFSSLTTSQSLFSDFSIDRIDSWSNAEHLYYQI